MPGAAVIRRLFSRSLSSERIEAIAGDVKKRAGEGDKAGAWRAAEPLFRAVRGQREAAECLLPLIDGRLFEPEQALEGLREIFLGYRDDVRMVAGIGEAIDAVRDIRYLNAAPPLDGLLGDVANKLIELSSTTRGTADESLVQHGLATTARCLGRGWDALADQAHRRRIELAPDNWRAHYNYGLFLKTRGRFAEGLRANQRAAETGGADDDSVRWNLGICATGAREADVALANWKRMGHTLELGRFGLPEGGFPSAKVRLAQYPLAERSAEREADGPGLEETIWVERLSACHGLIVSVLYEDLGVDYGDVVLFDGAPIMHHTYGERSVPVFPHLATLERRNYQFFRFAGTQRQAEQLAKLSDQLPDDAIVYVHTEQMTMLCHACWEREGVDHAEHHPQERHIVAGKIAAPPHVSPVELRAALDRTLAKLEAVRLFAPDLTEAAGDTVRARAERGRFQMLFPES